MIQFEKGRITPSTKKLFSSRWKFIPFIKHNGTSVTVISASGVLEKGDAFRIRRIVNKRLQEGVSRFILDFSETNHIHYDDVAVLVGLKEMVERSRAEVKFVVQRPYLIDIFIFAGWSCVDDVYPSEETALNSYKEHPLIWRERVQSTYSSSFEGNH